MGYWVNGFIGFMCLMGLFGLDNWIQLERIEGGREVTAWVELLSVQGGWRRHGPDGSRLANHDSLADRSTVKGREKERWGR